MWDTRAMRTAHPSPEADTATRILDVAAQLVQTQGFNGFSYGDVAQAIGLTRATLHHHFPTKADLGQALIDRYTVAFATALSDLDAAGADPRRLLVSYADLYAHVLEDRRMCLCGMLAAEVDTLPPQMRASVVRFFDASERWLEAVLERGRAEGALRFEGPARDEARLLIGGLEGAMLLARPYADVDRFREAAGRLIATLVP